MRINHTRYELIIMRPEWYQTLYPYFSLAINSSTKNTSFKKTVRGLIRTFDLYRHNFERTKWREWHQMTFSIKEVDALASLAEILEMKEAVIRFSGRTVKV